MAFHKNGTYEAAKINKSGGILLFLAENCQSMGENISQVSDFLPGPLPLLASALTFANKGAAT